MLLIPIISAVMALLSHDFGYNPGVAGAGIVILLVLYFSQSGQSRDVWMIIGAFLFSIDGDWFLSLSGLTFSGSSWFCSLIPSSHSKNLRISDN